MILGLFNWLLGSKDTKPLPPEQTSGQGKSVDSTPAEDIFRPKPPPAPSKQAPTKPQTDHVIMPGGKEDRLGDILLKHNIITPEKLQKALAIQASMEHPRFLGEILIDENMLTEDELVSVVSRQFKIPYIKINKYSIDRQILQLIPEELVREQLVLPVSKMGRELTVGMVNPQDKRTIKELENLTGCEIKIVLCKPAEIKGAIRSIYESPPPTGVEPGNEETESPEPTTTVISAPGVPLSQLKINADAYEGTEVTTDVVHVSEMPVRRPPFIIKGAKPPEPEEPTTPDNKKIPSE